MNNLKKLSEILNFTQKKQSIILSFLLLLMSIFEIIFLHLIFIVINSISGKHINFNFDFLELIKLNDNFIDYKVLTLFIFLIFFLLKTIFNILVFIFLFNYLYKMR